MYAIIGLGNPEAIYANTRHNIGFRIVDQFMSTAPFSVEPSALKVVKNEIRGQKGHYAYCELNSNSGSDELGVVVAKPLTYMNRSGLAVQALMNALGIEQKNLLVICDDANLSLGQLRYRCSGSSGGQKGLESIMEELQTQDFMRLRFGVGKPPENCDLAEYVLNEFESNELTQVSQSISEAAESLLYFVRNGISKAMNQYNRKVELNGED